MTATSIERNSEKFNLLPEDFKTAIKNSSYDQELEIIRTKHKLHIDQSATLEDVLAMMIFGEIASIDFVAKIEEKINVSHEEANAIAKEINEKIIEQIKENLKKIETEDIQK